MPKTFRRRSSLRRRRRPVHARRRRVKKKISRAKKYSGALKVPTHLSLRQGGFPPLLRTKLRFSRTYVLDPRAGVAGTIATLNYLAFSTNSLVNPLVAEYAASTYTAFIEDANLPCFMHHDDISQVYSDYRVNSSKITCAFAPRYYKRLVGQDLGSPTYVTLQVAHELPGSDAGSAPSQAALRSLADVDSCRAAGRRYLKIDPHSQGVPNPDTGFMFKRDGNQARQFASQGWSSKYLKNSNAECKAASVKNRPLDQNFYIISAVPQHFTDPSAPGTAVVDPTPVNVTVTIECNVTYWRYRQFPLQPNLADVEEPQPQDPI